MKKSVKFLVFVLIGMIGLFSIPAAAALPSGYTEMEWLYANGKQWTLSGYTPSCNDRIEMKVRINGAQYDTYTLFCSRGTTTSTQVMLCYWTNPLGTPKLNFVRNAGVTTNFNAGMYGATDYVVVYDGNELWGGVEGGNSGTLAEGEFTPGSELAFFGSHTAGANLNASTTMTSLAKNMWFYYARIYDSTGALVREYLPARDDSAADGNVKQYGLYETKTSAFYANNGSEAFYHPVYCRVTPDAPGGGDGQSWSSPMTLAEACAYATNSTYGVCTILMKTGTYSPAQRLYFTKDVTVRGGYAGTAGDAFSSSNSVSIIDGQDTLDSIVYIYHTGKFRQKFERLEFVRAVKQAIAKNTQYYAAGNLTVNDCRFIGNGTQFDTEYYDIGGCGICVYQGSSTREAHLLWVSNCLFAGNALYKASPRRVVAGSAIYVQEFKSAVIMDCTFITNGVAWHQPLVDGTPAASNGGAAIHSLATPTALVNCKFIGNRTVSANTINDNRYKGVVALLNSQNVEPWNCGLTNCLFLANESVAKDQNSLGSVKIGTVMINNTQPSRTTDVVNCTFAYNLMDTTNGSGGLCVSPGAAKVRNSIFYGNRIAQSGAYGCDLRLNDATASADVDYTLFGSTAESNVYKVAGATLSMGEHVYEGDPKFVSTVADFEELITVTNKTGETLKLQAFTPDGATLAKAMAMDAHIGSVSSIAIDTGDPSSSYDKEPKPNGGRINLGAYGNTPWAARSAAAGALIFFK